MQTKQKAYKGVAMEGFIATWYARLTKEDAQGYRGGLQECAKAVAAKLPPDSRVLELAPGPGYLAIELAKAGDYRISGLDISQSFVQIASENARHAGVAIEFQRGNASEMPYPDGSFDFVVCRSAFKNFADPTGALNEIHRVLGPGGKASIYDLRKEASQEAIDKVIAGMRLSRLNAALIRSTYRFILLKSAYAADAVKRMASESRFGGCEILQEGTAFEMRLAK